MGLHEIYKLSEVFSNKAKGYRKKVLKNLVDKISGGQYEHIAIDPNRLYMLHNSVREEYQRPLDISGYNWGHMSVWEMDAGMDESF